MDEIDILPFFFRRADYNYLGDKLVCNLLKNLSSNKGVLLMTEMSQLVIEDMACLDMATAIDLLIDSEQPLLYVEGVQNLDIFILRLTLLKKIEDLAFINQSVCVIRITARMLIHKLQGL